MRKGALAVVLTAVAFLAFLIPATANAANLSREILIYGEDTQELTTFKKLDCRILNRGGKFLAKGKSSDGWRIEVHANNFSGFGQDYDIAYGIRETNFAIYPTASNSPYYSNFFFPGDQPPPFGGALALSGNGKDMGLGFISAFISSGGEDAVGVAGHAKCKYPKKKR
ncbi:MAG: hypothetical protein U0R24_06995 [Solirubrobacterales bacterium]